MRSLILFIILSLPAYSASAQVNSQLIDEQLSFYGKAYPEIDFVLLYKMEDFDQLTPLTSSLGEDLSNVDYEHPDNLRLTLVEAHEYRITLQLENGNASATLFNTPNALNSKKPYACLITFSFPLQAESMLAATRFMYDLDEDALDSLPESYHLDNQDFMQYSIDHEVFHCIDAYTNGFLYPRTQDQIKVSLDRIRVEERAEIFASLAHLSRQPNGMKFLKSLATARTVNLLSGDIAHYTSDVLYMLAESNERKISDDIKTLVEQSMHLADDLVPSYTEHKEYLVTLWTVLKEFGIDTDILFSDYPELALVNSSPEQVIKMRNTINTTLTAIHQN